MNAELRLMTLLLDPLMGEDEARRWAALLAEEEECARRGDTLPRAHSSATNEPRKVCISVHNDEWAQSGETS
jgi:hypothetical protein